MKKNIDFSKHRLNDDSELHYYMTQMGLKDFNAYVKRVYRKISEMKPNSKLRVAPIVKSENRDLFIKILCYFIRELPGENFIFNETFTEFRKGYSIKDFRENVHTKKRDR